MSLNNLNIHRLIRSASQGCVSISRAFHSSTPRAVLYPNADLETFSKVIAAKDRIDTLVFFSWCGPCHQLAPVIERLTNEPNKSGSTSLPFDLVKIDADTEVGQALGEQYKVRALPTVIAFRNATTISQFVGAIREADVKDFLDEL